MIKCIFGLARIDNNTIVYKIKNLTLIAIKSLILLNNMFNIVKDCGWNGSIDMIEVMLEWIEKLEAKDLMFIKNFVLASGSLKEIAKEYDVTYPTARLRLDKLIEKIRINDELDNEPYVALIKKFAVDEKIYFEKAKKLISEYKKQIGKRGEKI